MVTLPWMVVLALAIDSALGVVVEDLTVEEQWQVFKQNYSRVYSTPEEEEYRLSIFRDVLNHVTEHNLAYKRGDMTYQLGINQFADMSVEELKKGAINFHGLVQSENATVVPRQKRAIPSSVDWRKRNVLNPVKNQGQCRACYAFAGITAVEAKHAIIHNQLVQLSVQQILDCEKNKICHGIDGGYSICVYANAKKLGGINTEQAYPYTGQAGKCKFDKTQIGAKVEDFEYRYHENAVANFRQYTDEIKSFVAKGPTPATVCVNNDRRFYDYNGGVYINENCEACSDHEIVIVGYDDDTWIIRNSWGTTWGESGYMKIKQGTCGIGIYYSRPFTGGQSCAKDAFNTKRCSASLRGSTSSASKLCVQNGVGMGYFGFLVLYAGVNVL